MTPVGYVIVNLLIGEWNEIVICVCMYVCVYIYIYIYIYISVSFQTSWCACVVYWFCLVCLHMCVCVRACMRVCVRAQHVSQFYTLGLQPLLIDMHRVRNFIWTTGNGLCCAFACWAVLPYIFWELAYCLKIHCVESSESSSLSLVIEALIFYPLEMNSNFNY